MVVYLTVLSSIDERLFSKNKWTWSFNKLAEILLPID